MLDLAIAWTRVHAINALRSGPPGSDVCRASTSPEGKTVWEHSPTWRKYPRLLRLNRGPPLRSHSVTVPHCYQGSLYPWALHMPSLPATWRPSRAIAWPRSRGLLPRVSATCTSGGPPGLCHVASVPRRTSSRSRAPRQPPLATSPFR